MRLRTSSSGSKRLVAFSALMAVAGGCGSTEPVVPVTFDLVLLQHEGLAYDLGAGVEVVAGAFTMREDHTFTRSMTRRRTTANGIEGTEDAWRGTWSTSPSALVLKWEANGFLGFPPVPQGETRGVWDGDRVALTLETGIVCVRSPCPTAWDEVYERR